MPHLSTPNRRLFLALTGSGAALALGGLPARAQPRVAPSGEASLSGLVSAGAPIRTIYTGGQWCEGPVWLPERGALVFSDVRANRMMIVVPGEEAETFREPSDNANGSILDAAGRLVTCEHRTRRVVREEADGTIVPIAEAYEGRPLNSPNDAALAPDGAVWFTDPIFGITVPDEGIQAEPEQSANGVYRIDPQDGSLARMIDSISQPNGIVFSADGRTLYVAEAAGALDESRPGEIIAFPMDEDGRRGEGRIFATIEEGIPDGLAMDESGNLYAGCFDGARIYAPDGTLRGRIATEDTCVNLTFGGPDHRTLFFTEGHSVHAVDMEVAGHRWA